MHILAIILAAIGGVIVFGSLIALSCLQTSEDASVPEALDAFLLGGIITGFRNLLRAVSDGVKNPKSSAGRLLALLVVGILLTVAGFLLM